ncbi:MAG: hypothetical protein ACK5L6_03180 [Anaerorhabdus sp.]
MIILLVGLIPLIYIRNCNICNYIKGYSKQNNAFVIVFYFKMVASFLIIPMIIPFFQSTYSLIQINLESEYILNSLEGYYEFETLKESSYHSDLGSERFIKLRDELKENNALFKIEKQIFFDGIDSNLSNEDGFYTIDEPFKNKTLGFNNEIEDDEVEIFIHENYRSQEYEKT